MSFLNIAGQPGTEGSSVFPMGLVLVGGIILLPILIGFFVLGVFIFSKARKYDKRKIREGEESYAREKPLWNQAMMKWQRLYLCYRNGIIFDPETQEYCHPDEIQVFIYR